MEYRYNYENNTAQPQAGTPAPQSPAAGGWEFVNGQWRAAPQPGGFAQPAQPQPPQKPEKKKNRAPGIIALILVCALAGFGGGALAFNVMDGGARQTVVYQAPDDNRTLSGQDALGSAWSVSSVAEAAGQSVVSITTENMVVDFFQNGRTVSGAGSGVIISEDGTIVTNNHVIDGANKIFVTLPDGTDHEAKLLGGDPVTDVAVVKINVDGLTPAVIGNSDDLLVGDFCLAIGNPMGTLGGTVTNGIISALNRQVNIDNQNMNLLQTNAAVSPGNSGGGLFDASGALIGIVNAKSGGDGAEGLGFAIPVNTAMDIARQIIENGRVTGRPALNVLVLTVTTPAHAEAAGVDKPGVYLQEVEEGGAAYRAGLKAGDRLVSMGGKAIENGDEIRDILNEYSVGDTVEMEIERDGKTHTTKVVLGELAS